MRTIEWKAMQAAYAQGYEEGFEEVREEDAVKLLALGIEPAMIAEAMGFSIEKLMDLLGPTAYDVGTAMTARDKTWRS